MSEPRFPYGYKRPADGGPQGMGTMLTWDEMMTKNTVKYLHPEVRRRLKALITAAYNVGVPLGVGTGWRVQPNPPPPGFAQPGNSWHESCPVAPTSSTAFAIDTVPDVSWNWMETHCGSFGFRTFRYVGNEPWHIQPTEISASRKYATVPPPLYQWNLPGPPPETFPPTMPPVHFNPEGLSMLHLTEPPVRIYDSRNGGKVDGSGPIVADFGGGKAAVVNVTVVDAVAPGFLKAWSGAEPETSVLNYEPGHAICNTILVGINGDLFMVRTSSACHLIVDLIASVT